MSTDSPQSQARKAQPIRLTVTGDPAPKGSSRAVLAGGRAVNIASGSDRNRARQKSWKTAVTDAWQPYVDSDGPTGFRAGTPLAVGILFRLALRKGDLDQRDGKPKATAPEAVIVKPDGDKLTRATWDALTSAGAWGDDAQIAIWCGAKAYVPPGHPTGAIIVIGEDWATVVGMWTNDLSECESVMRAVKDEAQRARERHRKPPRKRKTLADILLDFGVPS